MGDFQGHSDGNTYRRYADIILNTKIGLVTRYSTPQIVLKQLWFPRSSCARSCYFIVRLGRVLWSDFRYFLEASIFLCLRYYYSTRSKNPIFFQLGPCICHSIFHTLKIFHFFSVLGAVPAQKSQNISTWAVYLSSDLKYVDNAHFFVQSEACTQRAQRVQIYWNWVDVVPSVTFSKNCWVQACQTIKYMDGFSRMYRL